MRLAVIQWAKSSLPMAARSNGTKCARRCAPSSRPRIAAAGTGLGAARIAASGWAATALTARSAPGANGFLLELRDIPADRLGPVAERRKTCGPQIDVGQNFADRDRRGPGKL